MRRTLAPIPLALAALTLCASGHAQGGGSAFSPSERAQLLGYQLVQRDVSRTEGRSQLFGGTSWQRVDAPVEEVWRVVSDVAIYPRLIPSLERVRVVEEEGDSRVLHMHHETGIASTDYYARVHVDEARHEIRFELDRSRPHEVREGRGFLSLSAYRGGTIVAWGMLADVGSGMLQQLFGPFLNQWLLKPPRCVRDEVEPGRDNTC